MLLNPGASLFDALQREFDFSRRVWSPPTPPASPRSHSEYLSALLFPPPLLKRQSSGRRFFAQPDSTTTTADLGNLNPVETFPQLSITDSSNNNNTTTPKKASNFVVPHTVKGQSQSLQSRKIQNTKKRPAPTHPPIVINVDDSEDEGIDLQDPEFEEIAPERKQSKMAPHLPPLDASEKVTGRPVLTTTIVESTTPDTEDVEDTEDTSVPSEVRFELDTVLPQFDRADVSVNVVTTHHNKSTATPTLVIRAKRQSEDHSDVEEYHRRVKLPVGVAVNQLSHSFDSATGVLHVEAPVVVEKSRPKTTLPDVEWIEVNTTQPEVTSSRPAARLTHRREEILLD